MAYDKLNQAMALSRRQTEQVGIVIPEAPRLGGRFAIIDPQETARYNAAMKAMLDNLAEQIQRLPIKEK